MKTKTIEYEGFPRVYKMDNLVQIVYQDHTELYRKIGASSANTETNKFDPYVEVNMIRGNGGKRVHGMKTVQVIDFTEK